MTGTILRITRARTLYSDQRSNYGINIMEIEQKEIVLALSEIYTDQNDSDCRSLKVLYQNKVGYIFWFYDCEPYVVIE